MAIMDRDHGLWPACRARKMPLWVNAIRPQEVKWLCMTASALSILFFARFSGKERKESHCCVERCQGRLFLAFILTLDTALHTFTIDPGTKVRVLF